jgi:hypothetical protein
MSSNFHYFGELFVQLGLPADPQAIATYIHTHSPLHPSIRLEDAVFWSPVQAALLREHLLDDSDWAGTVDQLNLALRAIQS